MVKPAPAGFFLALNHPSSSVVFATTEPPLSSGLFDLSVVSFSALLYYIQNYFINYTGGYMVDTGTGRRRVRAENSVLKTQKPQQAEAYCGSCATRQGSSLASGRRGEIVQAYMAYSQPIMIY